VASSKTTLAPSQVEKIIQSPHIGYVASHQSELLEVFVIGTSHLRCNSAREVTSLIEQVKPDGVVLELDPERLLRLTKQFAGFDENGSSRGHQEVTEEVLYGADFLAAVNACQQLNIPMFLGDEYAQETKRRLMRQFLNWKAYSPAPLVQSFIANVRGDDGQRGVRLNLIQSFVEDPKKMKPILFTSLPPLLLASAITFLDDGAMPHSGSTETLVSIVLSFMASCLLFNTVISERDETLASSTMQASTVVRSLKENKSIRRRWTFSVNQQNDQKDDKKTSSSLPLFTLKNPLIKGATRNLNLFEPRWLKMIDEVIEYRGQSDDEIFGCVRCTNKFYSAVEVNGVEGRYADVIFDNVGTFARINELREGTRPVSGDRKINVSIQGDDSFILDDSSLSVSSNGYLVAENVKPVVVCDAENVLSPQKGSEESVTLVVVVGLLHGNGVVDLLSKV